MDITNKNKDELVKLLAEKRKALHGFRFNLAGSKTRNVKEGKNLRKDIARIMTKLAIKQ